MRINNITPFTFDPNLGTRAFRLRPNTVGASPGLRGWGGRTRRSTALCNHPGVEVRMASKPR
jgi:hypothetical protein